MSRKNNHSRTFRLRLDTFEERITPASSPAVRGGFDFLGPGLQTAPMPGPSLAMGTTHVVTMTVAGIQWRTKPDVNSGAGSPGGATFSSFFSSLSPSGNATFSSPRAIWDQFASRFVVAVTENDFVASTKTSRQLVAVSATADPTGAWYFKTVGAALNIGGQSTYAGYMAMGVDEEAVYLTTSHFRFSDDVYADARVRIMDKGISGGWYSGAGGAIPGGPLDPDPTAGTEGRYLGLAPAFLQTDATTAAGMGMLLVAYAGAQSGTGSNESVELVTINNPISAPTFSRTRIDVGDIDQGGALPDAPQPGSAVLIDTGNREVGNAVWLNDQLYFASVVNPNSGADAGQATVHWFQIDTTSNSVTDQGNVDETVAANLYTFSPGVAVNKNGDLAVGFSGVGDVAGNTQSLGAYFAARQSGDTAGTLRSRTVLFAPSSTIPYVERKGGAGPSLWSPYSSLAMDPNGLSFWAFNAFADTAESSGTDPGRWATRAGGFAFDWPPDIEAPIADVTRLEDFGVFTLPDLDANFSDYEAGDVPAPGPLTYSVTNISDPTMVTVDFPSRNFLRLTSVQDKNGGTFVTVRATDAAGGFTDDIFQLNLTPTPDDPVALPDSYTMQEDVTRSVSIAEGLLANDSDPDDPEVLTIIKVSDPTHAATFNLNTATGAFTYRGATNYSGPDSFTYKLRDSTGRESAIVAVSITVDPVNDRPVAVANTLNLNEDDVLAPAALNVLTNDTDVDGPGPMTAILVQAPLHAQFFNLHPDGTFDYTPAADYNGPDSFTYRAFDGIDQSSTTAAVTLSIAGLDDAPRPTVDNYQVDEDGTLNADGGLIKGVMFNDLEVDGETLILTLNATTTPQHGAFAMNANGTFTYTPVADYFGPDSFTYKVSDSHTEVGPVTVNITVNAVNDAPIAAPESYTTNEDILLSVAAPGVLANDTDIDSPVLTRNLVQGPAHALSFTFNPNGSFDYTPAANYYGPDSFSYQAFDGFLPSNTVTVNLAVYPIQDPVTAVDDNIGLNTSGAPLRINVLANDIDPDRDPLQIVSYTRPAFGRVSRAGAALIYTPNKGAVGVDTFSYTVSDGRGHTDSADVQVNVLDVVAPVAQKVRLHFGAAQSYDLVSGSRTILPWSNITKVSVEFSENVQGLPLATALTLTRSDGTLLPVTFDGYNPATRTATWTLGAAISIDRLTLRLAAAGVSDIAGNPMAADRAKSFAVLPGDYNGDGEVTDVDVKAIKSRLSKAGQKVLRADQMFADIDGSGIVDQADLTLATNNKGKRFR